MVLIFWDNEVMQWKWLKTNVLVLIFLDNEVMKYKWCKIDENNVMVLVFSE
jgi:hypothetical protein